MDRPLVMDSSQIDLMKRRQRLSVTAIIMRMPRLSPSPGSDDVELLVTALRQNMIFVSVAIALAGVIVAVIVYLGNTRIARRRATIDAWQKWNDDTTLPRARLADQFRGHRLTTWQAAELLTPIASSRGRKRRDMIDEGRRASLRRDLTYVLNGLERLATGVHHRLFERRLLIRLAGTTIQSSYVRYEEYISAVRQGIGGSPRQPRAYSELERLSLGLTPSEKLATRRADPN